MSIEETRVHVSPCSGGVLCEETWNYEPRGCAGSRIKSERARRSLCVMCGAAPYDGPECHRCGGLQGAHAQWCEHREKGRSGVTADDCDYQQLARAVDAVRKCRS